MKRSTTVRIAAAGLLGALAITVPATAAQADPSSTGCPKGYTLYAVSYFPSDVYKVPTLMDDVLGSFGRPANHNGLVCAVVLGNREFDGWTIYNFMDDSLPASS